VTSIEPKTSRYRRDRNSSWWVRMSDRIAKQIITIGGIGTILVVMLVVLVLLGNVLPMFQRNRIDLMATLDVSDSPKTAVVACGVDEYAELLWTLHRDGSLSNPHSKTDIEANTRAINRRKAGIG
jgi:ABC-type uncharacterized transport system permease subunit